MTETKFQQHVKAALFDLIREKRTLGDLKLDQKYKLAQKYVPNIYYTLDDVLWLYNTTKSGRLEWERELRRSLNSYDSFFFDEDDDYINYKYFMLFINACLNNVIEYDDVVMLNTDVNKYSGWGYASDDYIGIKLEKGKIIFQKKANSAFQEPLRSNYLGYKMSGGEILVKGNLKGDCLGGRMEGGSITINGNLEPSDNRPSFNNYAPGQEMGNVPF